MLRLFDRDFSRGILLFLLECREKTFFILVGKVPRVTFCWSQFGGGSAQGEPCWSQFGGPEKAEVVKFVSKRYNDKPFRGAWNLDVLHFQRRQFGAAFVPNREGRLDN